MLPIEPVEKMLFLERMLYYLPSMAKYKQPDIEQTQMVILNFSELFPTDHATSKLLSILNKLDLSTFDENYENDNTGRPAFPVDRLLAILFYSILNGNISMRTVGREIHKRAEYLYLSGGLPLDHSTLSVFRKRHAKAIEDLFAETIFLGVESNIIDFDTICLDSTKIKGNANREDIGTREDLEFRYEKVKKRSEKKYKEWLDAETLDEKKELEQKRKRLGKDKERLLAGLDFLKENKDRKKVHLTDHDAVFQKDSGKGFIVGYQAQVSVDAKNSLIINKEIATQNADVNQTIDLLEQAEDIKEKALIQSKKNHVESCVDNSVCKSTEKKKTKYVLDSGYASEGNLEKLHDKDVYMPDRGLASLAKESRKQKKKQADKQAYPDLEFKYHNNLDKFSCPSGNKSYTKKHHEIKGIPYTAYTFRGCSSCSMQSICAGDKNPNKVIRVRTNSIQGVQVKYLPDRRSKYKAKTRLSTLPLTVKMREKLKHPEGRKIYNLRLPVVEGVIGLIKAVRQGNKFMRRGLENVQTEWTERCIAHNLGKMIGFSRA